MRAHHAVIIGALSLAAGWGCTAYVAAELSSIGGDGGTTVGDCFDLPSNQCGLCIASACEKPSASPPVSLKQVCTFGTSTELPGNVMQCANDPRFADQTCQNLFIDGGTYASSITTQGEAENNVEHCISDNCITSCSECNVPVPTCGSTTPLVDAGACGVCLDTAMNHPTSPCQAGVLQGSCYEDSTNPIAQCAIPQGQCTTPDCSGLSSPDPMLDDAGYAFYTCLWQQCQGSCP